MSGRVTKAEYEEALQHQRETIKQQQRKIEQLQEQVRAVRYTLRREEGRR